MNHPKTVRRMAVIPRLREQGLSWKQVGDEVGLSSQRAVQIYNKAIRRTGFDREKHASLLIKNIRCLSFLPRWINDTEAWAEHEKQRAKEFAKKYPEIAALMGADNA